MADKKKAISFLLVLIMLIGMIPAGLAAEEFQQDAAGQPTESSKTVYRAFELSLQQSGKELAEGSRYKVTVQTGIDESSIIPEGAVRTGTEYKLFRIHGEEAEKIEDAEIGEGGILVFTTEAFGSFSLVYTVFYRSEGDLTEKTEEEPVILEADGVTVEVLRGEVPENTDVVITMLNDSAVEELLAILPIPQEA